MRIFAQVCSRCFGWGLPHTSMIPMADNLNHSDITVINETINKDFQKEANKDFIYFTKDKFMNDYTVLFDESEIKTFGKNITGRFNRERFESCYSKLQPENWKNEILDKDIWELPY